MDSSGVEFGRGGLASQLSDEQFRLALNDPNFFRTQSPSMGVGSPYMIDTPRETAMPGLAQPQLQPQPPTVGGDDNIMNYLRSKEGADNTYDTMNLAGSSAQGPYQITKGTGEWMKGKLGLEGDWNTPENQEKIMVGLNDRYSRKLDSLGVKRTPQSNYVLHQLGEARGARYFQGNLTSKDLKVMNDNLPEKLKTNDPTLIKQRWTSTYNR